METKEGSAPPVEGAGGDGKRTAILVIHGVGEQNPFEALDGFVCGLHKFFKSTGAKSKLSHIIKKRDAVGGGNWTESFVEFDAEALEHTLRIDVHECYWADLTEKKISVGEVYSWMLATIWGAIRFLVSDWEKVKAIRITDSKELKASRGKIKIIVSNAFSFFHLLIISYRILIALLLGVIVSVAVLYYLGFFGPDFSLSDPIKYITQGSTKSFSEINFWLRGSAGLAVIYGLTRLKFVASFFKKMFGSFLTEYLGDFVIYTTTDEKSSHFQLRQQILARTQSLLESLLKEDKYDRVIVAGHSLGSVIAFDVLNRINIKANLEPGAVPVGKIAGLITFGSPLDKVALFFGQHAEKNQHVRRQIIEQLYSFRAVQLDPSRNAFNVGNPIEQKFNDFPWVNYWSSRDPISGQLDFYTNLENKPLKVKGILGSAHVNYWETDKMYEHIISRFSLIN